MKSFQRFILILASLCLFFDVTFARTISYTFKTQTTSKSSSFNITHLKKSNILSVFDIDADAEEGLEEETDSEDIPYDYLGYHRIEFSFSKLINKQKVEYLDKRLFSSEKIPLFIQFRNIRL